MKYLFKVFSGRKIVKRVQTDNRKVFSQKLASASTKLRGRKLYLKVDYGNDYYNDGEYTDRKNLMLAYKAFIEA